MPKLAAHLLARALGSVETDDLPHPYGVWGLATPDRPASMVFEDDDDGGGSGDVGDDDDWWSVGFEGVYSDPLHKKCDRTIVKISDTKAEVSGYDAYYNFFFRFDPLHCDGDHDVAWGPFDGALDLSGLTDEIGDTTKHTGKDTITVDFSAKGGPSNLVGEWDPEVPGIKWADGNTWTWLRALESEGGVEGEEEGEAQGGSDAGGGRTRRRLRSTSERRRLEASSNSTNDGTDTSAAEEATPAASPTATPTSPLEDEVMASLKSIPGNYSDPDHPGCVRRIHGFYMKGDAPVRNTIVTGTSPAAGTGTGAESASELACDGATDEVWSTPLPLEYDTIEKFFVVDFSALNGPSDVIGVYDPTVPGIVWDESSGLAAWVDLDEESEVDDEGEGGGEIADDDVWITPLTEEEKGEAWRGSVFTEIVYVEEDSRTPLTNTAADENGVHQCLRRDPAAIRQLVAFVAGVNKTGAMKNYCEGGSCVRRKCNW
mmetsp:Transcript_84008/g.237852  ORF Transcript_84008/g.237852 Transcript_84008/m.237852 type:complete len:486 (+) Transcript_84008:4064-5521(+)